MDGETQRRLDGLDGWSWAIFFVRCILYRSLTP